MTTQAPAIHGVNRFDHACFAQPGEAILRWRSPGSSPIQYIVDRWPTGYEAWVCATIFALDVVPEVKYSRRRSSALVRPSTVKSSDSSAAAEYSTSPSRRSGAVSP